jgi:hypothetical protein
MCTVIGCFKNSEKFHFPFNANKFELLCRSVTVIEEQFFAGLNRSFGEYADAVVPVYFYNFGVAVGVDGMIGESKIEDNSRDSKQQIGGTQCYTIISGYLSLQ